MTSRDAFEAWYRKRWPRRWLTRVLGGLYVSDSAQESWESWEASRTGRTCEWTGSGEFWVSSCGRSWTLNEDTPEDNGMHFCPGCGARVVAE